MSAQFTCITCRVVFKGPELQRDHYKTDWHRYNLKRKVADLSPVTSEDFQKRVLQQRENDASSAKDQSQFCKPCSKAFSTRNAYANHLNSKKHKQVIEKYESDDSESRVSEGFVKIEKDNISAPIDSKFVVIDTKFVEEERDIDTDSEIEELDSDEWDDYSESGDGSLIKPQDCLFCGHHSKAIVKNIKHMTVEHSFFIPDAEYCVNLKGLLLYLGEKISRGFMCLWCNDKGKTFFSMEAARAHMVDKGHCKMLHEGLALAEYSDYYDYSSSYPEPVNSEEGMDVDADTEVGGPVNLENDDYQLVLPSGMIVGHRSLMRYYKQSLNLSNKPLVKKSDRKLHKVLGHYKALGWAPQQQEMAVRKAKDIHYMKRVHAKLTMQLSVKANKFQKHFRQQVPF